MKLFLVLVSVAVATAARLENTYLPPSSAQTAGGSSSFLNAPRPSGGAAAPRPSGGAAAPRPSGGAAAFGGSGPVSANAKIAIVRFDSDNPGDGTYKYSYETENRISHEESGQLKNPGTDNEISAVQGQFSYTGDDGATYSITYTADENGFRPEGAHLPVAPPIPAEILKSLEQNAADEAAGIVDDGQYRAEHQGEGAGRGAGSGGAFSGGAASGGAFSGGAGAVSNQYLGPKPSSSAGSGGYRY
ncbi:pupal cuticle protein 36 [Tribolium castaneum]|uniref:Cuticle protein 3-like Protein n=1 Tax=Tribolium castaneum TaxID=7070 RepID=D6WB15_TRICA|nr:PREDICTED: pupal cuticle protein 36 [Tribolium castaneum]EEZ98926.1 Cuticle protein 3-like Protein [Tribolium castaneum]|eukprot:XP_008200848.1 PREDICTED: pupal cuticle protein 36 [Tribolium castaneum]